MQKPHSIRMICNTIRAPNADNCVPSLSISSCGSGPTNNIVIGMFVNSKFRMRTAHIVVKGMKFVLARILRFVCNCSWTTSKRMRSNSYRMSIIDRCCDLNCVSILNAFVSSPRFSRNAIVSCVKTKFSNNAITHAPKSTYEIMVVTSLFSWYEM